MRIQLKTILDRFPELLRLESGDASIVVERLQTPLLANPQDMIFVSENRHLQEARKSASRIWVLGFSLPCEGFTGTLVRSPNPYLAMAWGGEEFFPIKPWDGLAIHPTAVVSRLAKIGREVGIGPGAV